MGLVVGTVRIHRRHKAWLLEQTIAQRSLSSRKWHIDRLYDQERRLNERDDGIVVVYENILRSNSADTVTGDVLLMSAVRRSHMRCHNGGLRVGLGKREEL